MPRLVTLAQFDSPAEAHLALNLLEGEGIEAFLHNEEGGALNLGPALGVKLQVRADQAEKAALLLDSLLGAYQDLETGEGETGEGESWDEGSDAYGDSTEPEKEELYPEEESTADQTARRALNAAVLGLFFFPAQYYSLYLIAGLGFGGEELSDRGRKQVAIAFLLDFVVILLTYWIFRMVLANLLRGMQ